MSMSVHQIAMIGLALLGIGKSSASKAIYSPLNVTSPFVLIYNLSYVLPKNEKWTARFTATELSSAFGNLASPAEEPNGRELFADWTVWSEVVRISKAGSRTEGLVLHLPAERPTSLAPADKT